MTQNATFNYINLGAFKVKESNSMPVPLNPDQQRIIEHREGPALVIAGAGSGKTRVVTQRVAHLIRSGVPASSILLLTFTNKAAREMALRAARQQGVEPDQQKILNGTFHSMASRFLRRSAKLLHYENQFSILDASDSRDLIRASIAEKIGKPGRNFPKPSVLFSVFFLAFNRYCPQESLVQNQYTKRQFLCSRSSSSSFASSSSFFSRSFSLSGGVWVSSLKSFLRVLTKNTPIAIRVTKTKEAATNS